MYPVQCISMTVNRMLWLRCKRSVHIHIPVITITLNDFDRNRNEEETRAALSMYCRFKGNTRLWQSGFANGEQMCEKLAHTKPHNAQLSDVILNAAPSMHALHNPCGSRAATYSIRWRFLHWNVANGWHSTSSQCARDRLYL